MRWAQLAVHLADEQKELLTSLLASARSRLEPHVGTADLQRGQVLAKPLEPMVPVPEPERLFIKIKLHASERDSPF